MNLGSHVSDNPEHVLRNRDQLAQRAQLPESPRWLNQVHGSAGVHADACDSAADADWSWTATPGVVCAVLTADCLPVLLCDRAGRQVAAVHAGWRGLCSGVLELAVKQFMAADIGADNIMAWLGPAIGPQAYEVDEPVRNAFDARSPSCMRAFAASRDGHWQLDLYAAAREILSAAGVDAIYGGEFCTYAEERFFSHRRAAPCGRQATLIWLQH